MKASELMIWDWVLCPDSSREHIIYVQIDAIEEGGGCLLVTKQRSNWFVGVSEILPIPLTSEILEKNGFKRYEHSEALWDVGVERLDEGLFAVGIEDDCGVGLCVMPGEIMKFYCKYVHELQHILRLLGVKKEVIL